MRRGTARCAGRIAVAGLCAAAIFTPANAQTGRRISDADVDRIIPVMQAMAGLATTGAAGHSSRTRDIASATAGEVADAAVWLKDRAGTPPLLPPDARYDRNCSAAVTRASGAVTAVYNFGAPRNRAAAMELLDDIGGYYRARDFEVGERHEDSRVVLFILPSAGRHTFVVHSTNTEYRMPACQASQGVIVLHTLTDEHLTNFMSAAAGVDDALARARLSEEEFSQILSELAAAAEYAKTPAGTLDQVIGMLRSTGDPEGARLFEVVRENLAVYRRHAERVDPLLQRVRQED